MYGKRSHEAAAVKAWTSTAGRQARRGASAYGTTPSALLSLTLVRPNASVERTDTNVHTVPARLRIRCSRWRGTRKRTVSRSPSRARKRRTATTVRRPRSRRAA